MLAGTCLGAGLGVALLLVQAAPVQAGGPDNAAGNAALVRAAFDDWRDGNGSVFDLLHENVVWTVAGGSPVSGTYGSRKAFMDHAVVPINARLATPITPQVQHVVAQGDAVVVVWEGRATSVSGADYRNHYAWHMRLRDGEVVEVIAFLDTWVLQALMAPATAGR